MATGTVTLSCACVQKPDLAAIDELARARLAAGRCGCELRLEAANDDLVALIEFTGLAEVLRVQVKRKAEKWKQPRRVEKEGELPDPPVTQVEHLQGPR
jgi:hypothetical protein